MIFSAIIYKVLYKCFRKTYQLKLASVETEVFQENQANNKAAHALAIHGARASVAKELAMQVEHLLSSV